MAGIFTMITNDGMADRMLMGNFELERRMQVVNNCKKYLKLVDQNVPFSDDIAYNTILAIMKPRCAIPKYDMEYAKQLAKAVKLPSYHLTKCLKVGISKSVLADFAHIKQAKRKENTRNTLDLYTCLCNGYPPEALREHCENKTEFYFAFIKYIKTIDCDLPLDVLKIVFGYSFNL